MQANARSFFLAAALAFAALASGCATTSLEGDGSAANAESPDVIAQLENDSRGK